jgi:hypothetical protein
MQRGLIGVLITVFCLAALASAGEVFNGNFTGDFAPANWTLSNDNGGDGYQVVNSSTSVSVYGANNGGGGDFIAQEVGSNYTAFTITAPTTGTVDVSWLYNTYDCCGSYWDPAGYTINGAYYQLTVSNENAGVSQMGDVSFWVNQGDTFGFYVYSVDSCCGAGEITISPTAAIPEPSTVGYLLSGLAALWFARRRAKR